MGKKIGIVLGILIVLALIGAATYFVILPRLANFRAGTSDNGNTVATTNSQNSDETNENAIVTGGDNIVEGNTASVISDPNYMFYDEEESFVGAFATGLFDNTKSEEVLSALPVNIPNVFYVNGNAISDIITRGGTISSQYESYSNPHISAHSLASIINDQYSRHTFLITSTASGGVGDGGVSLEAGRDVTFNVDLVVDLLNHQIVFVKYNEVYPAHDRIVEDQHSLLSRQLMRSQVGMENSVLDGSLRIKAMLLAVFSYSPFLDENYWNTTSGVFRFQSANGNISENDIAYRMLMDWHPTTDGSGLHVTELGEPQMINASDKYAYYTCSIAYKTVHDNPDSDETLTRATLKFSVDTATGRIATMTMENVQTETISHADAVDPATNPTIEQVLGVSLSSEES